MSTGFRRQRKTATYRLGAKDEFLLAATAQNLRKLAKLVPLAAPAPA